MRIKYAALIGLCGMLCTVCSCSTEEAAAQVLGASSEAPMFLSCKAVTESEIDFQFSLPVKVVSLRFSPAIEIESVEEGSTVKVHYQGGPGPGEKLTADLLAEDSKGNTVNVLVPLRSRNVRIPALRINEMRTKYDNPKTEFVEFKMLSAGNLGALRLFIAGYYKNPLVYEFAPTEVSAGEYVTLHLRTLNEANRDELGADLNESGGQTAVAGARDLWVPGTAKLLHETDAVYVLDQDDQVIDAVMFSLAPDAWWNKDYFANAADLLFKQGAWKSAGGKICSPADALAANGSTATRTICRDENTGDTNTAADWYITVGSGATPGR